MAELLYKQESYIIQGVAFDIYKQFRNRHKEKVYQNSFYLGLKNIGIQIIRRIYGYSQKKIE